MFDSSRQIPISDARIHISFPAQRFTYMSHSNQISILEGG